MLLAADNPRPRIFIGRSWHMGPAVWRIEIVWGLRLNCQPWTRRYRHGVALAIDLHAFQRAAYALRSAFFVRGY